MGALYHIAAVVSSKTVANYLVTTSNRSYIHCSLGLKRYKQKTEHSRVYDCPLWKDTSSDRHIRPRTRHLFSLDGGVSALSCMTVHLWKIWTLGLE